MKLADLFSRPKSPTPYSELEGENVPKLENFLLSLLGMQGSRTYNFTNPNLQQPTASPIPQQTAPYQHNIEIDTRNGKQSIPPNLAQLLMEGFDDIGEATNAARVLQHPLSQTYKPNEVEKFGRESWNYGENPNFFSSAPDQQTNGSWDRGLMRNNSGTFEDLLKNPYWARRLQEAGINNFEDVDELSKSIALGRITLENSNWDTKNQRISDDPSWDRWFAAPLDLRTRE